MSAGPTIEDLGRGVYRVEHGDRAELVFVAGRGDNLWAFWNGNVYRSELDEPSSARSHTKIGSATQSLSSPMPATVVKVVTKPGAAVKKGDTLVILEAMKMELPLRAPGDGIVKAVHCHEGDIVQPETSLVELSS